MKLHALTIALLASTGLANPIRYDVRQPIYTLRLSSPNPSLNNRYLTSNNSRLGIHPSPPTTPPIRFYPIPNPATGLAELRTVPPKDGDGAATATSVTLMGANGLLDLASLADPAAAAAPAGTTVDWTSFRLLEAGLLEYGAPGADGAWVAFPAAGAAAGEAGWSVKWKDVNAWTTANYMPVQVVYELVRE
ncbi:hypothetical protein BT67DRAFT_457496 [Trichocladium antarcticum]|uniref:Uncharacterized protein n=1 Tax=Trichocladium antarcticum TaxID=1450529 RepID=A0AAN6UGW6_9PEZI|nr:hypothetical protein BT67DRAFT_457496 [Trichocladium antarcticum]